MKISLLPSCTINQIAAGEVIENPASVVKELVENAIDAGAKQVVVETSAGGFQRIQVSDDGLGMGPEDALLSIERHATSKLLDADDLFALTTMGFRGEALASIASISKMELLTAAEGSSPVKVEVEGGKVLSAGPAARAVGTTVSIRSLFYNVPARKKFQKSATASSAEITRTMTQLALAHPEVGFELIQQQRTVFSVPYVDGMRGRLEVLEMRVRALMGEDFFASCLPIDLTEGDFDLLGFVANPLAARHNRSGQSLFINRRPVSCPAITYAIRDAYGTRLSMDRHPVFLLHFKIAPALVDVNVHPQKKEVRLLEGGYLKYKIHAKINDALSQKSESQVLPSSVGDWPFSNDQPFAFAEEAPLRFAEPKAPEPQMPIDYAIDPIGIFSDFLLVDASSFFSEEKKRGIVFFDLPAAEAAVCYAGLLSRNAGPAPCQRLLFPLTFSFSKAESAAIAAAMEELSSFGLQMHQIGEGGFLVDAIPPFFKEEDLKEVLHEVIGEMQGLEKEVSFSAKKLSTLAASLSQRVRRERKKYRLEEGIAIVKALLSLDNYRLCPRGRPTLHYLEEDEINAFFPSP